MLTKEIGFREVLKEVFDIKIVDDKILKNTFFEATSIENVHMTPLGYSKIIVYLQTKEDISTKVFLGLNATFAYGHPTDEVYVEIERYINKYKNTIFLELEETVENISKSLNKQNVQYYKNIIEENISYNLLESLSSLSLYRSRIYKDMYYYGLQNLLLSLSKYCYNDFEEWFLTSDREDLKIVYAESLLNSWHSFDYLTEEYINSRIPFVKALAIMIYYNVDRNISITDSKKDISNLNDVKEESLYFILYSFKYRAMDLQDNEKRKILSNDIQKLSIHLQLLTITIFEDFLGKISNGILFGLIDEIKNPTKRHSIYKSFFIYALENIETEKYISTYTIQDANVVGNILFNLESVDIESILKRFDKEIKKINEPYYVYKFHEDWGESIVLLIHYLIIIFIYYQEKNKDIVEKYKKLFLDAKKSFNHYSQDTLDDVMQQIKC